MAECTQYCTFHRRVRGHCRKKGQRFPVVSVSMAPRHSNHTHPTRAALARSRALPLHTSTRRWTSALAMTETMPKSLYEKLGVDRDSTQAEGQKGICKQALLNHPDKNPGEEARARPGGCRSILCPDFPESEQNMTRVAPCTTR